MEKGKFIAFEGIDGSGKSTMLNMLYEHLSKKMPVYMTAEPSRGNIGVLLRQILSGKIQADASVAAALFAADRLDHITNPANGILEKRDSGITVLTDRFYLSSYAYQGVDNPLDWIISINSRAAQLMKPDLHIFIDISPETAMKRIGAARQSTEIYENIKRLEDTRARFKDIINRLSDTENIKIIDGEREPADVWEDVKAAVESL